MAVTYMNKDMAALHKRFPWWRVNAGWKYDVVIDLTPVRLDARSVAWVKLPVLRLEMPGATEKQMDDVQRYLLSKEVL
jgi:hypothetical protein